MIRLIRPSPVLLDRYLAVHSDAPIDSAATACPRQPPPGFSHNQLRGCLGTGAATFCAARTALCGWKQFPGGWIDVYDARRAAHLGQTVAVVARCLGLWSLNSCRVIDVCETPADDTIRFAVVYGTVAGHMLEGAERFSIEWDRSDDRVWYDLSSYSRPRHWLARLLHPVIRRLQRRFARDSLAALRRAANQSRRPEVHSAELWPVEHVDDGH